MVYPQHLKIEHNTRNIKAFQMDHQEQEPAYLKQTREWKLEECVLHQ